MISAAMQLFSRRRPPSADRDTIRFSMHVFSDNLEQTFTPGSHLSSRVRAACVRLRRTQMFSRFGISRHRLAAIAAGATAVTISALTATNYAQSISLMLDDETASELAKSISASMAAESAATSTAKKNTAFVFAKPHANTPAVLEVILAKFAEVGITVLKEGVVTGEEIDSKGFIDQHYYAIAEKSTLTSGKDLPVSAEKFKEAFGEDWSTVVAEGRAFNALEFQKRFAQFQPEGALDQAWDATSAPGRRTKLGGGFYCGQIPVDGVKYYTFNAFFMTMRGKFTKPGTSIHYYVVEFDPSKLSWGAFRGEVLGPTNPADAPTGSLRGIIAANWQKLGLLAPCDGGDNAVHASASPFEGLAERTNWLAGSVADDPFGSALLAKGVSEATIKKWSSDPQVKYDEATAKEKGKPKGSIFDALEDLDYEECLERCVAISKA